MPETTTGFQARIMREVPGINKRYAERLGRRMKHLADRMQAEFDFYRGLRILGIYEDPTARDAVDHLAS